MSGFRFWLIRTRWFGGADHREVVARPPVRAAPRDRSSRRSFWSTMDAVDALRQEVIWAEIRLFSVIDARRAPASRSSSRPDAVGEAVLPQGQILMTGRSGSSWLTAHSALGRAPTMGLPFAVEDHPLPQHTRARYRPPVCPSKQIASAAHDLSSREAAGCLGFAFHPRPGSSIATRRTCRSGPSRTVVMAARGHLLVDPRSRESSVFSVSGIDGDERSVSGCRAVIRLAAQTSRCCSAGGSPAGRCTAIFVRIAALLVGRPRS